MKPLILCDILGIVQGSLMIFRRKEPDARKVKTPALEGPYFTQRRTEPQSGPETCSKSPSYCESEPDSLSRVTPV